VCVCRVQRTARDGEGVARELWNPFLIVFGFMHLVAERSAFVHQTEGIHRTSTVFAAREYCTSCFILNNMQK
jgi:hypothetical protein